MFLIYIILMTFCFLLMYVELGGAGVFLLLIIVIVVGKLSLENYRNQQELKIVGAEYLHSEVRPEKGAKRRIFLTTLLVGTVEGLLVSAMEREYLYHSFRVRYNDGSERIVECLDGSAEYNKLIAFARWENSAPANTPDEDREQPKEKSREESGEDSGTGWNEQAIKAAKDWLEYEAYSRKALIERLEYDGFTHEEAEYGADNCGADWNEQAVRAAKDWLEYEAYSRKGLIERLEADGFTHEQAEYGADAVAR